MIENLTLNNLHFFLKPPTEKASPRFPFPLLSLFQRQGKKERKLFRFFLCQSSKGKKVAKKISPSFSSSVRIDSSENGNLLCGKCFPFPHHPIWWILRVTTLELFVHLPVYVETWDTFSHFKDTKWFLNCFCPRFSVFYVLLCVYVCEVLWKTLPFTMKKHIEFC